MQRLRLLFLLPLFALAASAEELPAFAAVRAADQERIAATIARDTARLSAVLSQDLHYANADGRVQTKVQFLAAVRESSARYLAVEPRDVKLLAADNGAVTMMGRAHILADDEGRRIQLVLQFLAVWREENGHWRLLAYQSTPASTVRPAPQP